MPRATTRRIPLEQFLQRRKFRRWVLTPAAAAIVLALILLDRRGWLLYRGDDWQAYHDRSFLVQRVIDGDTLVLATPGGPEPKTRVRVWGIDTPELARPQEGTPAESFADEAAQHVRDLCEGRIVRLTLEHHRMRDPFGRLIAHVWTPEGTLLSESLLSAGLARADSRWSHAMVDRFAMLERQARHEKAGIWAGR